MIRLPRLIVCLTALMIAVAAAHCQAASSYPTRPVRLLIPYAPGGSSDYVVRIIQPRLAEHLGQQAIIENRAGASGNIGVEIAANATPEESGPGHPARSL